MNHQRFDLLVVGSGPAGQQAAVQAAKFGKTAGIIERKPRIGGAGLHTGTIPSKALREAAYLASRSGSRGMRGALERSPSRDRGLLAEVIRKKDVVIAQQESVMLNRLMQHGVSLIPGEASFEDEHVMRVTDAAGDVRRIGADIIVLATGSRPRRPSDVPFDKKTVLDSTSILKIRTLPHSLAVIGGGVIACEFASFFAALGTEVVLIDSHDQILSYLSGDIAQTLSEAMQAMGVQFLMARQAKSIERSGNGVHSRLSDGMPVETEALLYALGREPNYQNLHINNAGLEADDHGWISVNAHFQTRAPHIYAVGDLIGRPALASTGMEQGRLAALHAFTGDAPAFAHLLPMAIYTIPELSWVGKTERELHAERVDYVTGRGYFRESARGQIIGDQTGLLKMNVDRKTHRILGVHIVGESASELIHIGQMIMKLKGAVDDIVDHVFNYPTLAECYKLAARDCMDQLP